MHDIDRRGAPRGLFSFVGALNAILGGWLLVLTCSSTAAEFRPGAASAHSSERPAAKALTLLAADIDGTGTCDALTDGMLIIRYLFGMRGEGLTGGAIGPGATRATAPLVEAYLAASIAGYDVDGNGRVDALTDGLLIVRYMFGLRGAALVDSAIGTGATRTSADAIQSQIAPLVGPVDPPPGAAYFTAFPAAENPLSEGGSWTNGQAVGIDWNNVRTVPGKAYGSTIVTGYNDDIAVLNTAFTANQYAEGTVSRAAGYSPPVSHEIELLLRFRITPHSARGYEVLWAHTGEIVIVRWNGPLGNYTPLEPVNGVNIGRAVEGDVLRAEISGSVIKVYKNGALVLTGASDSTWSDGQPGIGFWPTSGSTPENYGWKAFTAGSL